MILSPFPGTYRVGRMFAACGGVIVGTASRIGVGLSNRVQISGIGEHQTFAQRCWT